MTLKVSTPGIDFSRLNGQTSSSTLNLPSDFLQILLMALTGLLQEKGGGEPKTSDLSSGPVPTPSLIPPQGPDLKGNGNPSPSEEEEKLNSQDLLHILQGASGITGEGVEFSRPFSGNVLPEVEGEVGEMATSGSHTKLARIFEEAIEVSPTTSVSSKGPEGKDSEAFGRIESPGVWEVFQRIAGSSASNPLEGEGVAETPSVPFLSLRKEFEVKERAGKDGKPVSEAFREVFSRSPGKIESEGPDPVALWNLRKNSAEDTGQATDLRLEIPSHQRPHHEGFYQEVSDPRVERPISERAQDRGLYPKTEALKTVTPEGAFKTPSPREGLNIKSRNAEAVFSSLGPEREGLKIESGKSEDLADLPVSGPERNRVLTGDRGPISLREVAETPSSISNLGDPVSPERMEQIIKDLVYELRPSGEKKARIKLEPPELGEMEIDLKVHDKKVEILLKVERPEAARELHLHLSHLKHSLEQMGLNLSEFQVTFFGSEGGGSAYSFRDAEDQKRNPTGIEREDFSEESTVNEGRREGLLNIVV